jgi:L-alanine-DL-glutamate epimerase-like enolase superfamily enzyme
MKITAVKSIVAAIPFAATGSVGRIAGQAAPALQMVLVRVETETGLVGWGEAFGHAASHATRAALDTMVAPQLIGRDARDIAGIGADLERKLHLFGRSGPVMFALSGIDIALWDIAGKAAGLPLYRLLGGAAPTRLRAYSSLLRCTDPQAVAACCREAMAQGVRDVKLHEITVEAVRAAREALGPDAGLMLDTNCPWTVAEAVEMAQALAPFRLTWLEEPVWPPDDHAGLARVRATGIRTSAGENATGLHDFLSLFRAGALDVAQPSVTKIGGISGMRRVMALAEPHGVDVVPHCGYLGPGFLATLHLIAAMPRPPLVERLHMTLAALPFGDLTEIADGHLRVPQGPGLGCDPDPEMIRRYAVA